MPSYVPTIRAALHDAVETKQTALEYIINNFVLQEAARKKNSLDELTNPHVTIIGASFDEELIARPATGEAPARRRDVPIYVFIEQRLSDPATPGITNDLTIIDPLLVLLEQLMTTAAALAIAGFTWTGNRQMKDSNGLPYDFHKLDEQDLFEASFTANYTQMS